MISLVITRLDRGRYQRTRTFHHAYCAAISPDPGRDRWHSVFWPVLWATRHGGTVSYSRGQVRGETAPVLMNWRATVGPTDWRCRQSKQRGAWCEGSATENSCLPQLGTLFIAHLAFFLDCCAAAVPADARATRGRLTQSLASMPDTRAVRPGERAPSEPHHLRATCRSTLQSANEPRL